MSTISIRMYGILVDVMLDFMDKPFNSYSMPFFAKDDDQAKEMVINTISDGAKGLHASNYSLVCYGDFYPERKRMPFVLHRVPVVVANLSEFVTDDFLEKIAQKDGDSSDEEKNI